MSHFNFTLPNVRKCFVPDTGYEICDCDLAQADARVVAWEAEDDILKEIFRDPSRDLHSENAKALGVSRDLAKRAVHAINYTISAPALSRSVGVTVHDAERFIYRWFSVHPGIKDWHRRCEANLLNSRTITNKFGYKRVYFDRVEQLLGEAVAWIPQSTVALIITKAMIKAEEKYPNLIQPLLQVHDSFIVQYRVEDRDKALLAMKDCMHISVPYPDPLIIPSEPATSTISWGDVKKTSWPK